MQWRVVSQADVNIRAQPSASSSAVGTLQPGAVIVGSVEGEWVHHAKGYTIIAAGGKTLLEPTRTAAALG
jgi:hypothetical protein